MTRARDLADYIATGVSDTELDILDGLTSTTAELNILDGVTSTAAELNILDGVTSTTAELNILDGVTATAAELNYVDGVTSSIQTQMNNLAGSATIAVTVVNSGGNKYAIDGTVQQLTLLTPSVTYRFDQSDSSNSGHPLRLSTTSDGSHGGGSAFTTGVTAVGTPGNAGAYTEVKLEQDAPDTLYYYCTNHSGMGGEVDVRATVSSLSDLSITSTAAELNILDGVTSTAAELNILDGVTSTAAELNILDGVTSTAAELNTLDGVTAVVGELNALDLGSTAVGNAIASKAVILDSNKDYTGLRNVTATGAITGGSFVIGSADINENDLESIDGITAGTIAASKAAVVDANKDITGFRNVTLTGELDAGSLDISGDADIDGTLETDALSINGTAVTSTAAELNILDGVTSTAAELNILDGVTSTAAELNILDGVTSTAAELNALDGITAVVGELNALDIGSTAVGTAVASKAVILDSNKDYTGVRNFTLSGELDAGSLDISGNADIDGTLETDNLTVGGAQGSDGQVLTSTGSGVGWEDAAGGASALVASTVLGSAAASVTITGFSTSFDMYLFIASFRAATADYLRARWTADNGSAHTTSLYAWGSSNGFTKTDSYTQAYMFHSTNGIYVGSQSNVNSVELSAIISNPKNDTHVPSLSGHAYIGNSNITKFFSAQYRDEDIDVGGIELSMINGNNFIAGSHFRIYGLNKS